MDTSTLIGQAVFAAWMHPDGLHVHPLFLRIVNFSRAIGQAVHQASGESPTEKWDISPREVPTPHTRNEIADIWRTAHVCLTTPYEAFVWTCECQDKNEVKDYTHILCTNACINGLGCFFFDRSAWPTEIPTSATTSARTTPPTSIFWKLKRL